jgi:hypothetical protein
LYGRQVSAFVQVSNSKATEANVFRIVTMLNKIDARSALSQRLLRTILVCQQHSHTIAGLHVIENIDAS